MTKQININADMAEGFGAYDIGNDDAMLDLVASANIACGFHGGDPNVMARVTKACVTKGVSIGAHPGFNDLWGFGRRRIQMPASDVEAMIAYQIGALQAFATIAGSSVTHVKPHGAINNMASEDRDLARAIARGVKGVDPSIIMLATTGSELMKGSEDEGLNVASEVFADRTYDDNGNLTSRKLPNAMIRDAKEAADHALHMATHGEVISTSGKAVAVVAHSICIHGDEPTGPSVAAAVRAALEGNGFKIVPLPEVSR